MLLIKRFDRLMQRFTASLIFPGIQNDSDSGLKGFAAHGIAASAADDLDRQFMPVILSLIDGGVCLLVD